MTNHYSPHTGEAIHTDTPADWMGRADKESPDYNRQTHGCFWRGTDWEVVPSVIAPVTNPRIAQIDAEILALEAKAHRPTRDALAALAAQQPVNPVDAEKITEVSARIAELRAERRAKS